MSVLDIRLPDGRTDRAREIITRLGLREADARPIVQGWREANRAWRRERKERVAAHASRVQRELLEREGENVRRAGNGMGRARAVVCVELQRPFRTLSDAAKFVGRSPSNILQSIKRGVRCGGYHWEAMRNEAEHPETVCANDATALTS